MFDRGVRRGDPTRDEGAEELTNEERLAAELADLTGVLELLYEEGIKLFGGDVAVAAKKAKVKKYMNYSRELGILHK